MLSQYYIFISYLKCYRSLIYYRIASKSKKYDFFILENIYKNSNKIKPKNNFIRFLGCFLLHLKLFNKRYRFK